MGLNGMPDNLTEKFRSFWANFNGSKLTIIHTHGHLNIVFQAIIVSRVQYAISVWRGFLTADLTKQVNAFFFRARQNGFSNDISFACLLFAADQTLFSSICKPEHCLHAILLPLKSTQYYLRERGHAHPLPDFKTCLQKIFSFALFISNKQ
jgi:hypothetical protein